MRAEGSTGAAESGVISTREATRGTCAHHSEPHHASCYRLYNLCREGAGVRDRGGAYGRRRGRRRGRASLERVCSGIHLPVRPPPPLAIALASGLLLALAAPPANVYPALWLGLAGFAFALTRHRAGARDIRGALSGGTLGLAFGFGANVVAFRFVAVTITRFTELGAAAAWLAVALLSLAQGLSWAACAIVHDRLAARGVPRWAAFAVGAYAATFFPQVFPWTPAGGAAPWPATVQLADVVGERGVTALMALAAGLVACAAREALENRAARRWVRPATIGALLPFATAAYGAWRMSRIDAARAPAPSVKVALVQPGIEATERWEAARAPTILADLTALTRRAESRGVDFTIWPEAAYPYPVAHASRLAPIGPRAILQPGIRGPVLTGLFMTGGPEGSYNAAAVATANGQLSEPYDKRHLLWFGESVPLADEIPWIKKTFVRGTGLAPGAKTVSLAIGQVRAAVLNCFEDTLPAAGREAASVAPNLLVNVTNDAWFAGTPESELHLRLGVLRSVELRRDMVRAVNMGTTSWVDAAGRVRARYDVPVPGTLVTEPRLVTDAPTVYARAGDAPWVIVLSGALLVHLNSRRRRAQNAKGAPA
jgi:apolipoprotein N-acyltransferase